MKPGTIAFGFACALLSSSALAQKSVTSAAPVTPLRAYADLDSKDAGELIEQVRQDVYANQQKLVGLQFQQTFGDTVAMQFVWYPSGHETIPGYLFRARDRISSKSRQPAVVMVHGGFHGSLTTEWLGTIAALAERGYVVMVPEYRGSRGYGSDIYRNDYGVTDVADVLAAAHYLKTKEFVNGDRLGIVGRSRGGMITLLAIEHEPDLFRAAVDIVGLADMVAYMAYKPDYRRRQIADENPSYGGKLPSEDMAPYLRASPVNAIARIETPLLVLATTGDAIVPLEMHSKRVIEELTKHDKTFDYKIYEDAPGGHQFEHADTPQAKDAHNRVFAWLEKYLSP